ncbi:MAG TPA: DUF374 domain-containing protein [Pyrinomonadaceae bacterium]|nr:DUF374 domain-containing protein [Pyrinomonadaceae bacterium]
MQDNYHINGDKLETGSDSTSDRLALIARLGTFSNSTAHLDSEERGRNLWTRMVDSVFGFVRSYATPLHWLGIVLTATVLFIYARLVALTARLKTSGELLWPNVPAPSVLALWHQDAPSLFIAFAKRRPAARTLIMVASDPRGDFIALLCRMLGLGVVRGDSEHGGWNAINELAEELSRNACVIITADGDGPARIAKVGAVALASATGVPIVPLSADCHPAIQESHKWDAARNPVPFSSLHVWLGEPTKLEPLVDLESIERARSWLEETLNSK